MHAAIPGAIPYLPTSDAPTPVPLTSASATASHRAPSQQRVSLGGARGPHPSSSRSAAPTAGPPSWLHALTLDTFPRFPHPRHSIHSTISGLVGWPGTPYTPHRITRFSHHPQPTRRLCRRYFLCPCIHLGPSCHHHTPSPRYPTHHLALVPLSDAKYRIPKADRPSTIPASQLALALGRTWLYLCCAVDLAAGSWHALVDIIGSLIPLLLS